MPIKTKRLDDPVEPDDGHRLLVCRPPQSASTVVTVTCPASCSSRSAPSRPSDRRQERARIPGARPPRSRRRRLGALAIRSRRPRRRSLDQPGPLARRGSHPGRRSSKRRASRRVTGGSSLRRTQRPPSGLRRRCRRLPCSGVFLPGTRRASPVPMQPFAACCRPYPAGIGCGCQPAFFRRRCRLRHGMCGSALGRS